MAAAVAEGAAPAGGDGFEGLCSAGSSANFGRQIFLKMFNGCAQYGYEDVMKLHTNGSGTALPKDFFLSETCPESKIQRTKVLICVNNENNFDREEKPQPFPRCKASLME